MIKFGMQYAFLGVIFILFNMGSQTPETMIGAGLATAAIGYIFKFFKWE